MNARNFVAVVSVGCLAALAIIAPANVARADEASHDVLAHWVGEWTSAGTAETAGSEGESGGLLGKPNLGKPSLAKADWKLEDKFVQGTNSDPSGKALGIWMLHFDDASGQYQVWYFTAAGSVLQWNGTWSDADKTMTWSGNEHGNGLKLSGYTKFDGDKQTWELKIERDGKVTTDTGSLQKK